MIYSDNSYMSEAEVEAILDSMFPNASEDEMSDSFEFFDNDCYDNDYYE